MVVNWPKFTSVHSVPVAQYSSHCTFRNKKNDFSLSSSVWSLSTDCMTYHSHTARMCCVCDSPFNSVVSAVVVVVARCLRCNLILLARARFSQQTTWNELLRQIANRRHFQLCNRCNNIEESTELRSRLRQPIIDNFWIARPQLPVKKW